MLIFCIINLSISLSSTGLDTVPYQLTLAEATLAEKA